MCFNQPHFILITNSVEIHMPKPTFHPNMSLIGEIIGVFLPSRQIRSDVDVNTPFNEDQKTSKYWCPSCLFGKKQNTKYNMLLVLVSPNTMTFRVSYFVGYVVIDTRSFFFFLKLPYLLVSTGIYQTQRSFSAQPPRRQN